MNTGLASGTFELIIYSSDPHMFTYSEVKVLEFSKVLRKRRSIRSYKDTPVGRDLIVKVFKAARIAPSAAHRQPWHYIVVEDKEIREKLAGRQGWAKDPPVIIVALADTEASSNWCYNDVGISFEHLILAATDIGLGTCWIGLTRRDEEIRNLLGIPDTYKVIAMTPLGYHDVTPDHKVRKSLEEIVSWGKYSSP